MKRFAGLVLAAVMLIVAPVGHATFITLSGELNAANENNPLDMSPGTGFAFVGLDTTAQTLHVIVTFSGLLTNTTASHIHCCVAPGGNAGVATLLPAFPGFPLGVTSGSSDSLLDLTAAASYNPAFILANGGTVAGAEAALIAGLLADETYLNIHTVGFPGGEIRALLSVPEPATLALLGLGLAALVLSRRRKLS